ncbi:MAG: DUF535 family protein [Nannocystaceae bacterium]
MIPRLIQGFSADFERTSLPVACLRVLRISPLLATTPQLPRALLDNRAFQHHVRSVASTDHYFYLSHRHYLARGLSRPQRAALALHHYEHETSAFGPEYFRAVYEQGGLTLWESEVRGTRYDLRLQPGNDVLYEGGLSVVLSVNGGRVCVVSFSNVDPALVFERSPAAGAGAGNLLFICRKQLAANHSYQDGFNAAFDRCTAGHFALAAVAGVARAQGHRSIAAIRPEVHPGCTEQRRQRFETAYADCWRSLSGTPRGRVAYELPVPLTLRPLTKLTSKRRRRAVRRRRHLDEISGCAESLIRGLLHASG